MSIKDRESVRRLADSAVIVYARSSAHPIEYAITSRVHRDGTWRTIHLFDNAHAVEEHHEHRYVGDCKQSPRIIEGTTNAAMASAMRKLRANWREILETWEHTR